MDKKDNVLSPLSIKDLFRYKNDLLQLRGGSVSENACTECYFSNRTCNHYADCGQARNLHRIFVCIGHLNKQNKDEYEIPGFSDNDDSTPIKQNFYVDLSTYTSSAVRELISKNIAENAKLHGFIISDNIKYTDNYLYFCNGILNSMDKKEFKNKKIWIGNNRIPIESLIQGKFPDDNNPDYIEGLKIQDLVYVPAYNDVFKFLGINRDKNGQVCIDCISSNRISIHLPYGTPILKAVEKSKYIFYEGQKVENKTSHERYEFHQMIVRNTGDNGNSHKKHISGKWKVYAACTELTKGMHDCDVLLSDIAPVNIMERYDIVE